MAQRSGLALAVLALAVEEPMHPYRMQQLIRERGKDRVINVGQRSQLYKTIDRLERDGLLAEHAVEREATRPERTVYTATDAGRRAAIEWTVDMLVAPRPEFGEFAAALAYLPLVTVTEALAALRARLAERRAARDHLRDELADLLDDVPRLHLVEEEYLLAQLETDVAFVEGLVDDLTSGALTWNRDELIQHRD
jgi:DNA-binding PadR family transcriptional regulator